MSEMDISNQPPNPIPCQEKKEMDEKLRSIIEWAIHNGILAGPAVREEEVIITKSVDAIKKVLLEMLGDVEHYASTDAIGYYQACVAFRRKVAE